ncbi:MAG: hypothetical protein K6F63_02550 [Lachnospiraceae bacterium]|nr:hypothetical protein [Lachnospiraceae bacterium]
MKTKILIFSVIICLILAFAAGAGGILRFENKEPVKNENLIEEDTLIGVLVTRESLAGDHAELFGTFLKEHPEGVDRSKDKFDESSFEKYSDEKTRIYATGNFYDGYRFDSVPEAVKLINSYDMINGEKCNSIDADTCFSDILAAVDVKDDMNSNKLSAVLMMSEDSTDLDYYFNYIYQTKDGKVYARPTYNGHIPPKTKSIKITETLSTALEKTVNSTEGKMTERNEVSITVKFVKPGKKVTVSEFDKDNELLKSSVMEIDKVPSEYRLMEETEYIVVETESDQGTERKLYSVEDRCFELIRDTGKGYCFAEQHTFIK